MTRVVSANYLLGLAVLSYLSQRPMHAYELHKTLRDNDAARAFKLSYGALYGVVGRLENAGHIERAGTSREGNNPERTVYALTETGRGEMQSWLRELVAEPQPDYPAFAAALSLVAALPPDEVVDLLTARLERIRGERDEIRRLRERTIADGVHPLFLVEDDYRAALLGAEADFIERFIADITRPETGWAGPWADFHATREGDNS